MYPFDFYLIQVFFHSFYHSVKSYFCSIGDIRKNSILQIIINCFQHRFAQMVAKCNSFPIDLFITSSAEK